MNNLKDILAKIEQGSSWVSYDKISGTGPDKVAIKVEPGWMGRLPRETYVAVEKGKVTKLATITQKGIERVSVDPANIMFDMEGGTAVINAKLNSASVKASCLTLGGSVSKCYMVSMNVNGLSVKIPDEDSRYVVYADPEDPGATDLYDASFVIAMPKNMDNEEHHEMFVLNGKVVNINQQPNDIPYIILDHDFDNVTSENGQVVIDIKSNTEYDIELVCCTCGDGSEEPEPEPPFNVDPQRLTLNKDGDTQIVRVEAGDDVSWRITEG